MKFRIAVKVLTVLLFSVNISRLKSLRRSAKIAFLHPGTGPHSRAKIQFLHSGTAFKPVCLKLFDLLNIGVCQENAPALKEDDKRTRQKIRIYRYY